MTNTVSHINMKSLSSAISRRDLDITSSWQNQISIYRRRYRQFDISEQDRTAAGNQVRQTRDTVGDYTLRRRNDGTGI